MSSSPEEEEEEERAAKSPAAQAGSALLPALHLPFLPPHLYQPGKGELAGGGGGPGGSRLSSSSREGAVPLFVHPCAAPAPLPSRVAIHLPPRRCLGFPVPSALLPAPLAAASARQRAGRWGAARPLFAR